LLPHALLLTVAGFFLLPTQAAYGLVFFVSVPPCLVAAMLAGRLAVPRAAGFWLAVVLIVYSALTLAWGEDSGGRAGQFALGAAATLGFVVACGAVLGEARWRARLGTLLVVLGAASAALCVARFGLFPPPTLAGDTPRLRGWGITAHPVLGAAVLAVPLLTALRRAVAGGAWRGAYWAAVAVMAADIALTKSRGPAVAALLAALVLLWLAGWRRAAAIVVAGLVGAWVVAPGWVRAGFIRAQEPGRWLIWRQALAEIAERPVFGHGLAAYLRPAPGMDASFPHDLYLSLLFYSGCVGLVLFLALAGWALWRCRGADEAGWLAALMVNALAAGVTDFGQVTKGPGELWVILWLPVMLVVTGRDFRRPVSG
jgi:O-antigen ligase